MLLNQGGIILIDDHGLALMEKDSLSSVLMKPYHNTLHNLRMVYQNSCRLESSFKCGGVCLETLLVAFKQKPISSNIISFYNEEVTLIVSFVFLTNKLGFHVIIGLDSK